MKPYEEASSVGVITTGADRDASARKESVHANDTSALVSPASTAGVSRRLTRIDKSVPSRAT
jgi:hypothetical protein